MRATLFWHDGSYALEMGDFDCLGSAKSGLKNAQKEIAEQGGNPEGEWSVLAFDHDGEELARYHWLGGDHWDKCHP